MIGASLLLLATGCAPGPMAAPDGYSIERMSGEQGFIIDSAYIGAGDGLGWLAMEEAIVRDDLDVPANDIRVEVISGWSGAYVIAEEAVKVVSDLEESCESGAEDPENCDVWFDSNGNQHVEFSGEYENVDDFRPTYLASSSDRRGMLRYYVFIDSVPIDENGEPLAIPMYISIGVAVEGYEYEFN